MYDLSLSSEQQEIRDTVRNFVNREVKAVALKSDRLEASERRFPPELLQQASQLGLRTLSLSEASGGAGADTLTACIVAEELAAGDVNFAAVLVTTSMLGAALFDRAMTAEQRTHWLPQFAADDDYHLAHVGIERAFDVDLGASYHRSCAAGDDIRLTAVKQSNGDWLVNGTTEYVANATLAKLIAAEVRTDTTVPGMNGVSTLLVPRSTAGLSLREPEQSRHGQPLYALYHGVGGELVFSDCRVPGSNLLGTAGKSVLADSAAGRDSPVVQAMNLGVGRAAYEAALDYAKLRKQGGRPIIEHQAIGTLLAEIAVKLEVARSMVWKAAWAADQADTTDLPLASVARVFTAEAMHKVALKAAEVFGATGVMRDMPLQKYVHDTRVFLHAGAGNGVETLKIAEAIAGYRRT